MRLRPRRRAPERRCRRAALERKLGEQQTERRRHEHGAPERLYGASTDEHADRARRPAGDGGAEEDDDADEEEAPSAEAVGQPPGRDERGREDDAVRVQDPGELAQRALRERRADVRESDVDDGHVEEAHEDGDGGHEQDLPPACHTRFSSLVGALKAELPAVVFVAWSRRREISPMTFESIHSDVEIEKFLGDEERRPG